MVDKMKMNEKGIIRIIEASAAILIIFIVILTFSMTKKTSTEKDLSESITPLLEEIAKNNTMREMIIDTNLTDVVGTNETIKTIKEFLLSRVDTNIGRDVRICEIGEVCGMNSYPTNITGNVYAGSRIISSSLTSATPKRISIFLWFKK